MDVYKRDTANYNSRGYIEVPATNLFSGTFQTTGNSANPYEVRLSVPTTTYTLQEQMNANAPTGTYKIVFRLCDGGVEVDDDVVYVIVKKYIEEE